MGIRVYSLLWVHAGFISSAVVCANKHLRCVEPEVIVVFQQQLSALGNLFGDFQVQEPRHEPVVGICIDLNIWALRQGRRGLLRTSRFGLGRRTKSFGWLPTVTPMDPVVHKSSNRRQHSEPRVRALLLVVTALDPGGWAVPSSSGGAYIMSQQPPPKSSICPDSIGLL